MSSKRNIVVTGFGLFAGYTDRNPSWEAVKLLPDMYEFKYVQYRIDKLLVPVEFDAVDEVVPQIWKGEPTLVIHAGVHGGIETINLEKCAYTSGYCRPGLARKNDLNKNGKRLSLQTKLDVDFIAKELTIGDVRCCCSTEVGTYLCGYIYLKSLEVDQERTLFVHVPDVDRPYSSEQTKDILFQILHQCMKQLDAKHKL
ncbi:pyroglutamyl-peptidase 1-like [Sabethes cyaneus]|uniref:pyroglutamyl-peptidase 1-like n=1 Tax=Sabethes cyaneus TaxID=53552 RepID=UPI00237D50A5|nr:pyroglutamyl-peptidase 1-like [Sabethes cyaneus]